MLVTAVPAYATTYESTTITVAPDKTTANPGDIITYTITLGPVSDMGTLQMELVIPTGLTYVANSGKLADGLKAKLGFDDVAFTEVSLVINGVASAADYESASDTEIATFQCKVNDGFTGTTRLGLTYLEFYSCQTWTDHTSRFTVEEGVVLVEAAPVAVTGVTIDETLSVKTGESKTPSYTVNPAEATNKAVSFKSDNPAVATVNETTGEVTGVKEGTATITITTADGNFTDTCVV
ncbi:MAG: Ig domain-containing protein, partial [Bacteroidaceae bacterium]|nr:Ig domain-containing protein [Bacteroidaceae bacterium]